MPMYYKLKNVPLSMAFQLADGLGGAFDDDPYNGSIMDLATASFMSQMAKQYPTVSRQIIFDPASQIVPTNYDTPGTWNSSGNVTKSWTYSNAADHTNYKLGQAIQSLPLKEGKFYFEIHLNNLGTYNAADANVHLFVGPMAWNFRSPFETIIGRTAQLELLTLNQFFNATGSTNFGGFSGSTSSSDVIGVAYDTAASPGTGEGKVHFSHNDVWNSDATNSAQGNAILTSESPFAIQFHPYQLQDGAGGDTGLDVTGFDITVKVGTDLTYSPPTGYLEH